MSATLSRFLSTGLLFLLIFLSGYWLSRAGKPYPVIRFNLHKFIALGSAVFIVWTIFQAHQITPLAGMQVAIVVLPVLLALVTIITGGLLSAINRRLAFVEIIHKVFPFLTAFSALAALYAAITP